MFKSPFGQIIQLAYVVDDIDRAAVEWVDRVGAGPFYVRDLMRMDDFNVRGMRTNIKLRVGVAYWGSIQVELIQALGSDTVYRPAMENSPGKLHHCATLVPDIDAMLTAWNLERHVLLSGRFPTGLRLVYLDQYLPDGTHLELIEAPQVTLDMLASMETIARQWDGKDPVRSITTLSDDIAKL